MSAFHVLLAVLRANHGAVLSGMTLESALWNGAEFMSCVAFSDGALDDDEVIDMTKICRFVHDRIEAMRASKR